MITWGYSPRQKALIIALPDLPTTLAYLRTEGFTVEVDKFNVYTVTMRCTEPIILWFARHHLESNLLGKEDPTER